MIPNKTALFFIPAVAVGAIGGIQAMSGLEFWDTFGFTYSMFFFVYVAAYVHGGNDYRLFIEAKKEKKPDYSKWTDAQKLDAVRDLLLQCRSGEGSVADVLPESVNREKNDLPQSETGAYFP